MPRVAYNGWFDPQKIPALDDKQRERPDVVGYRAARGPKAAAFHPWGRLFTVVGSASQREAEERALAACNDDPQRNKQEGPCVLYATGDRVVLPQGAKTPITSPPPPSGATLHERLLDALANVIPSLQPSVRESQATAYLSSSPHKALAALPPVAPWRVFNSDSAALAEESALEACQVRYGGACVLVAVDDVLVEVDSSASRRPMWRVAYDGLFDPQMIPLVVDAVRRRPDVAGYRTAKGFKAAAFHPWGRLFIETGATSQRIAEDRALSACNNDPQRNHLDGQCLLYAVGDQVVLPKRLTAP
jgi:hypothetical protein